MIELITKNPIAYDSPDHLQPWGTANDNYTSSDFITELEMFFNNDKINFLDLGCSGGQLVVDMHNRGHLSIGLEGSDYSVIHGRANWPIFNNKNLFTCDVTKPYSLKQNNSEVLFDVVTAWEVVEHIKTEDLNAFFMNVDKNLKDGGIFLASIATHEDIVGGFRLHQSVFPQTEWIEKVLPSCLTNTSLQYSQYPFIYYVRGGSESFHIMLKKNKKDE
jgi:2-polyprenyl-3-methyl-5-hydroxy-6-metoxy-1,4-benzoquinol methylase